MSIYDEIKEIKTLDQAKTYLKNYRETQGATRKQVEEMESEIARLNTELDNIKNSGSYIRYGYDPERDILLRIGELVVEENEL